MLVDYTITASFGGRAAARGAAMGAVTDSVKERIRSEILCFGAGISGTRIPSERDLQQRFGASRPTINRALTELAAEGLLVRAPGRRHYSIADHARAELPPRRDTSMIGYVAGDLSSVSFGAQLGHRVFRGIHDMAARHNVRVLMGVSLENIASERAAVANLIESGASGLVIWPFPRTGREIEDDYLIRQDLGVPVVLLDNCTPSQGHTQIVFDNRRAGYDMASWLIEQGHRRIGIVTVADNSQHMPVLARLRGYKEALADHEVQSDPRWIARISMDVIESRFSNQARVDGRLGEIIDGWLGLDEPPTAIMALEDSTAIEIIELLRMRGVRVPEQVCVTGFDNLDMARLFRPNITTTRPEFHRMGELACSVLLEQMSGENTSPRTYVLEAPLLVRTSALAGGDEPANQADERILTQGNL
ncbi:MAG: GntR family transcriptional regulator [Capsulimonadaceae bacterium]|nr:GntR family transcriptional regulator [Capsulimonadaceae bacterium]